MTYDRIISLVSRAFAAAVAVLIALGVLEFVANLFHHSLVRLRYTPGRFIYLAAALATIIIALLLRQIRDELRLRRA